MNAAQLELGQKATVIGIRADESNRLRMIQMGVTAHAPIRIVKRAPLGDPLELEIRGYRVCLRKAQAESILVHTEAEQ